MKKINILVATVICLAATATLSADAWNKKTKVTFSGPVQLPAAHSKDGVVSLGAGTYIFRLDDSQANRHIIQVTNERGNHVYSTILALPDYRLNATSKTVMYFSERPAGTPPAIKSWFYPGDNFGHRFVYPKVKAVQIAAETHQPVPSHTMPVVEEKAPAAEVKIQTPEKQEVAYAPQTFDKVDATDTAGVEGEPVKAPQVAEAKLPKTASPIYEIGLLGLMLMGASLLVRRLAVTL